MQIFTLLQQVMGGTLTAGFIAHDHYYIKKYMGLSIYSIGLLVAILFFHTLIFLQHVGYAEVISYSERRLIKRVRMWVAFFTISICLSDYIYNISIHNQAFFSYQSILSGLFSMLLVIFPEIVFRVVFSFRKKGNF